MEYRITTDLAIEPVSLAEAKAHIVVDYTIDDVMLLSKIKAARQWLEQYTGLAFGEKTIQAYYDYNDSEYGLPIGPVILANGIPLITSITRTVNGVATLLTSSDYVLYGLGFPQFTFTQVWCSCGLARSSYQIVYQAGYNVDNPLPEAIKEAICKLTAEFYRDRENSSAGSNVVSRILPHNVRSLVSPYVRNVRV
jgi:uncharacterized phiE125 gp8 family phage protein